MANDPSIYDSREQLDFARRMAESLLKSGQSGYTPDAAMAKLPGTWMYGVPNIIKAISGAQYRDIAGDRESKLISQKSGVPDIPAQRYGARISQPAPQASRYDPSAEVGSPNYYTNEVKKSENEPLYSGKINQDKAVWDVRKNSIGFGTTAKHPDEIIDTAEAHSRFDTEWQKAQDKVEAFKPGLPEGTKAALTSLTYNAGESWMKGRLGEAIQNGDKAAAREYFMAYSRAPGERDPAKREQIERGLRARREREVSWFDHLTDADKVRIGGAPTSDEANIPPTADAGGQPNTRMNLGGPGLPGAEGSQQPTAQPLGEQVAQARNPQAPIVTTNPQMSPPQDIPGYGIPPAKPVMTPEQLDATMRLAPAADRAKIHEDHMKRMEGEDIETPFGKQRITPPAVRGEQPIVTNMPNKTIPLSIEGITLHMVPRPDGSMDVLLPGGKGTQNFKDVTDIVRYAQQLKAEGSATNKLTEQKAEAVTSAQHEGMASVPAQRSIQQMLAISKATGKGMPSGPTKDFMKQFGQFYDNFVKGEKDKAWKDLPEAETFDKLNSYLASESTKAITSRGTNFDLQTFMRANPSLSQTKEGRELMLDILNQEMETKIQLGIKASKYKAEDLPKFQEDVKKYYDEHPISVTLPSTGKKIIMKTLSKQERDQLEPGTGYIAPNGEVYYKK